MPRLSPKIDYEPLKDEYINTDVSIRKLAAKYGVSWGNLANRARREGWQSMREAHGRTIAARTMEGMIARIAEQERAVRLEQVAVLRATLHKYAADMRDGKVHVAPKDAILAVEALSRLMVEAGTDDSDNPIQPKNVTPSTDAHDPEFWAELVEHARGRVAASGSVGPTPISGASAPRTH